MKTKRQRKASGHRVKKNPISQKPRSRASVPSSEALSPALKHERFMAACKGLSPAQKIELFKATFPGRPLMMDFGLPGDAELEVCKEKYPELFAQPHQNSFMAEKICRMLSVGMHTAADDRDYYGHLKMLHELASYSLGHLFQFGMSKTKGERGFAHRQKALNSFVSLLTKSLKALEKFEQAEMKAHPQRGMPIRGQSRTPSILHLISWASEFWPSLLSTSGAHASKRQKFIKDELELAFAFHRKPIQKRQRRKWKGGESVESEVAEKLHDAIAASRRVKIDDPDCPARLAAWNLKPKVDADWWKVAEMFLEEWYGKKIGEHPKFKHWVSQNRRFTTEKHGDLRKAILREIRDRFFASVPRLQVVYRGA